MDKRSQVENLARRPTFELSNQTPDQIWRFCYDAFVARYCQLEPLAAQVFEECPRCFAARPDKYPKAFTYDLGHGRMPFVSIHQKHSAKFHLEMAHEFGHAVQLVASLDQRQGQTFMPPMYREWCAFLSELAFLDYMEGISQKLHSHIIAEWQNDNWAYFGDDLRAFRVALDGGCTFYEYEWNYPISRALSIGHHRLTDNQGDLFKSGGAAHKVAAFILEKSLLMEFEDAENAYLDENLLPSVSEIMTAHGYRAETATTSHAVLFENDLDDADKYDLGRTWRQDWRAELYATLENSGRTFCVTSADHKGAAIFGVTAATDGAGQIWLLQSKSFALEAERHHGATWPHKAVAMTHAVVELFLTTHSPLFNFISERQARNIRWLTHSGFRFSRPENVNTDMLIFCCGEDAEAFASNVDVWQSYLGGALKCA